MSRGCGPQPLLSLAAGEVACGAAAGAGAASSNAIARENPAGIAPSCRHRGCGAMNVRAFGNATPRLLRRLQSDPEGKRGVCDMRTMLLALAVPLAAITLPAPAFALDPASPQFTVG